MQLQLNYIVNKYLSDAECCAVRHTDSRVPIKTRPYYYNRYLQ